jgi:hypothetical protein
MSARFNLEYLLSSSFQQAVVRNFSDANTQLQKQLENVVREGNKHYVSPPALALDNFDASEWGTSYLEQQGYWCATVLNSSFDVI